MPAVLTCSSVISTPPPPPSPRPLRRKLERESARERERVYACVVVVVAAAAVVSVTAKRYGLPLCAELDDRAIQIPGLHEVIIIMTIINGTDTKSSFSARYWRATSTDLVRPNKYLIHWKGYVDTHCCLLSYISQRRSALVPNHSSTSLYQSHTLNTAFRHLPPEGSMS